MTIDLDPANAQTRMPMAIIIDNGSSLSRAAIQIVRDCVKDFVHLICTHPLHATAVELMICTTDVRITANDHWQEDWKGVNPQWLHSVSSMGAALDESILFLNQRCAVYRNIGIPNYTRQLFIISDADGPFGKQWDDAVTFLHEHPDDFRVRAFRILNPMCDALNDVATIPPEKLQRLEPMRFLDEYSKNELDYSFTPPYHWSIGAQIAALPPFHTSDALTEGLQNVVHANNAGRNTTRPARFLCTFVIDTASSVPNDRLEKIHRWIEQFIIDACADKRVRSRVEIAIITSAPATVVQPFCPVYAAGVQMMNPGVNGSLGRALATAVNISDAQINTYRAEECAYNIPRIIVLCDEIGDVDADWIQVREVIENQRRHDFDVYAVSIDVCTCVELQAIFGGRQRKHKMLHDTRFANLFSWSAEYAKRAEQLLRDFP
jgi:uncharacterized protein YegL